MNPKLALIALQRRIIESIMRKTFEYAVEKMEERGFERDSVKRIGKEIIFDIGREEKTGMKVDWIKGENIEDYVERYIDAEVDQPKYKYDESLTIGHPKTGEYIDMWGAIPPGTKVNIDAIEEWVRFVKAPTDSVLQVAQQADWGNVIGGLGGLPSPTEFKTPFEQAVDRTVYRVARKIYYVGRKPMNMSPEDWDTLTRNNRPAQGTYSKNESWENFPYTPEYEYRTGTAYYPSGTTFLKVDESYWKDKLEGRK